MDQLNATPTFTVNNNNDKSTTTTGNKTATARLILLPSIVSICWMLEMNGIIKQGQRNNFVGRIFITRSCWKDFEKDGIVLDYAMRVTLFFSFLFLFLNLFLIGSISLNGYLLSTYLRGLFYAIYFYANNDLLVAFALYQTTHVR